MRFMVIVKANEQSEAGVLPSQELLTEMGKFNEELVEGRRDARRRGAAAELEGRAGALQRRQADGGRRAVRRDQGAGRRLLADRGEVDRRGDRVDEARCRASPATRARSRSARCSSATTSATSTADEARERAERVCGAGQRAAVACLPVNRRSAYPSDRAHMPIRNSMAPRPSARSTPSGGSSRPRLIAGLARIVRDVGARRGPRPGRAGRRARAVAGVGRPGQPGRLADGHREAPRDRPAAPQRDGPSASTSEIGRDVELEQRHAEQDLAAAVDDDIGDDLLRLIFTACHPVLCQPRRGSR